MEIPQTKKDFIVQLSQIHGIPQEDLEKYYQKHLDDPTYAQAFPNENDLMDYIDNLLITHIQEFHSAIMEEFEIFIIASSTPRESRQGNVYNGHTVLAKRPQEQKPKWMAIMNTEDTGVVQRLKSLDTGSMKVNIREENEQIITAFSRPTSEFVPKTLTWIPADENGKKEFLRRIIKKVDIASAGQNLSARDPGKDGKPGFVNKFSLRLVRGTIASHRIKKITDEETGKERETAIITLVDKSVATNPEFFKQKTKPDPKNPGKTLTEYGGFSAFCEPDDVRLVGKESDVEAIGYINSAHGMNAAAILPILAFAPKKPTEKLQKPGTHQPQAPIVDSTKI